MRISVKVRGVGRRVAKRARELLRACARRRREGVDGMSLVLAPASTAGRYRAVLILDGPREQRRVSAVHGSAHGALTLAVSQGFDHPDERGAAA